MLATLTNKQKADLFANAINLGYWDYFDQCKWCEKRKRYRYYCAGNEQVKYLSIEQLAHDFDTCIDKDEQLILAEEYFAKKNN